MPRFWHNFPYPVLDLRVQKWPGNVTLQRRASSREGISIMDMNFIIQLIAGALGGNAAGAVLKN